MPRRKVQPTPRRRIANSRAGEQTSALTLLEPAAAGGLRGGAGCRVSSVPGASPPTCITIPSLTFSLQPRHLRIPLTFPPSHHRLLRFALEVPPHLHPPPLPPGPHPHPASSLSAPVQVSSLPARTSIPGLPWSRPPTPSTQAPQPRIPEPPACHCLPRPSWSLPPPGLGRRGTAVPAMCPPAPPPPPGTSEAGLGHRPRPAPATATATAAAAAHLSSLQVPVRTLPDLSLLPGPTPAPRAAIPGW